MIFEKLSDKQEALFIIPDSLSLFKNSTTGIAETARNRPVKTEAITSSVVDKFLFIPAIYVTIAKTLLRKSKVKN